MIRPVIQFHSSGCRRALSVRDVALAGVPKGPWRRSGLNLDFLCEHPGSLAQRATAGLVLKLPVSLSQQSRGQPNELRTNTGEERHTRGALEGPGTQHCSKHWVERRRVHTTCVRQRAEICWQNRVDLHWKLVQHWNFSRQNRNTMVNGSDQGDAHEIV